MSEKFKPEWEKKCWGRVQHIFANPQAAVSKLEVEAGWMCSRHCHKARYNMFAVTSGTIVIEQWRHGSTIARTLLQAGDVLTVPPGVYHRFRIVQSGSLVEVYWPGDGPDCVCSVEDIHRLDEGGRDYYHKALLLWAEKELK